MLKNMEAIVFDLGGVLLNLDFARLEKSFTDAGVKNFKDFFGLGHADSIFKDYEVGRISDKEFVKGMVELSGGVLNEQTAVAAWNSILLDFPKERVDLLAALSRKYRIFLYSNTNAIHYEHFAAEFKAQYGRTLNSCFEKAYYSHEIGYRKPEPAGYEYITRDAGLDPKNLLFIDDAEVNVLGARAVGWNAYWLKPGEAITDGFLNP